MAKFVEAYGSDGTQCWVNVDFIALAEACLDGKHRFVLWIGKAGSDTGFRQRRCKSFNLWDAEDLQRMDKLISKMDVDEARTQ